MTGACCDTCRFYFARIFEPGAAERALRSGILLPDGECRRYPQTLLKRRDEGCGEYQQREGE
jgi:hypothetical protein